MAMNSMITDILLQRGCWKCILTLSVILTLAGNISADLIFEDSFEEGLSKWRPVPAVAELTSTSREGDHAVLFKANPDSKRSEFVIDSGEGKFAWGEEYWIGFSIMISVQPKGYRIISQHHSTPGPGQDGKPNWDCVAGANSFTIVAHDGVFSISTSTNPDLTFVVPEKGAATGGTISVDQPFVLKRWYDFVLHFRYTNDNTGFFEIWVDGKKIVDVHDNPTVYNYDLCGEDKTPEQYQKIGIYHGTEQQVGEIVYDAYRIGDENSSYEEVAPRGEKFGALDDILNVEIGQTVQVSVLDNDMGSGLTVHSNEPGEHGSTLTDGTTVTYTPYPGFMGNDFFAYTIGNLEGKTDTAIVSIYTLPSPSELARNMHVTINHFDGKYHLSARAPDPWPGVGEWHYTLNGSVKLDSWLPIVRHDKVLAEGQDIDLDLSDFRISRYKYFRMVTWLE